MLFIPASDTTSFGMVWPGRGPARRQRLRRQRGGRAARQAARFGSGVLPSLPLRGLAVHRTAKAWQPCSANPGHNGQRRAAGGAASGGGAAGGAGDSGFAEMADLMLRQLLSKEVLLQPMMDIGAKYPAWLDAHRRAPLAAWPGLWNVRSCMAGAGHAAARPHGGQTACERCCTSHRASKLASVHILSACVVLQLGDLRCTALPCIVSAWQGIGHWIRLPACLPAPIPPRSCVQRKGRRVRKPEGR
jgi:hypothetical protein